MRQLLKISSFILLVVLLLLTIILFLFWHFLSVESTESRNNMANISSVQINISSVKSWINDNKEKYSNCKIDLELIDKKLSALNDSIPVLSAIKTKSVSELDDLNQRVNMLSANVDTLFYKFIALSDKFFFDDNEYKSISDEIRKTKQLILSKEDQINELKKVVTNLKEIPFGIKISFVEGLNSKKEPTNQCGNTVFLRIEYTTIGCVPARTAIGVKVWSKDNFSLIKLGKATIPEYTFFESKSGNGEKIIEIESAISMSQLEIYIPKMPKINRAYYDLTFICNPAKHNR